MAQFLARATTTQSHSNSGAVRHAAVEIGGHVFIYTDSLTCLPCPFSGAPNTTDYPPQKQLEQPIPARNSFDGSNALFTLYNRKKAEFDRELVGNWIEHIRDLIVLVRYSPFF
jgi:hypothetical protein